MPDQRDTIIRQIVNLFASMDAVRALYQAGSAANQRADQWSDIDLVAVADDQATDAVFQRLEDMLSQTYGIDSLWKVPEPAWHGHRQRFYKLKGVSPFLLIDFVIIRKSAPDRFLETSRHGTPLVYLDRDGEIRPRPLDTAAWQQKIDFRLRELAVTFPMFQPFVTKELKRGRAVDAFNFYIAFTIRPLVELLRIRHCPDRFDFGLRYLTHDLPAQLAATVEQLVFVGSPADLDARQQLAIRLFAEHLPGPAPKNA